MAVKKHKIPFQQTGQFSKLFLDYINNENGVKSLYSYRPAIDSFKEAMEERIKHPVDRTILVDALLKQYKRLSGNPDTQSSLANIDLLKNENTFTVCTGHQLCLFTGPLYFIYKIISTINLAEALKKKYPQNNFIPVYWMASEDHDFEEIRSFHLFGKTLSWNNPGATGAVGRLNTAGLADLLSEIKQVLGESEHAKDLMEIFETAYTKHTNLADATRYLVHALFGAYGLVILDGDDVPLKTSFLPFIKDDITNNTNFSIVNSTIEKLKALGYDAQVNPRGINVFKLSATDRIRIEKATDETLNLPPENYSPNVVLRPLYQQYILPNLAYVGGPGEIAYWLEYKAMFDHHKIQFPVLIPRNFALLADERTEQQIQKLGFVTSDFFRETDVLIKEFITKNGGAELSLKNEEEKLTSVYNEIISKATAVDPTLKGSVEAELQKVLNALKNIESKLLRSEKQKQETSLSQIKKIKEKFFPEGTLQERYDNFVPYFLKNGQAFISELKECFDPFELEFLILS